MHLVPLFLGQFIINELFYKLDIFLRIKMTPVIIFLIILSFWVIPVFFVLRSNKVSGKEKLAWILAITFVSWFAWLLFALLAPLAGSKKRIRGES
jgi:hypothetical protein